MASHIITRGLGNGSFQGSKSCIITHGLSCAAIIEIISTPATEEMILALSLNSCFVHLKTK
jgi:hypothetical protein